MIVAIASDHAGFRLKSFLIHHLPQHGWVDMGTHSESSMDYPDVAHPLAAFVESGQAAFGILICGSGNGVNIVANKHAGIRSALCWNLELALLARQHNDANVLALPARFIEEALSLEMVEAFLTTAFEGGRHATRVSKIPC